MRTLSVMRSSLPSRAARGRARRGAVGATVLAMCATALAFAGTPAASAAQAPGNDVVTWRTGWSWTYATTFNYADPASSTNASINENVTYTVNGSTSVAGQDAYVLGITGNITGGGGSTKVDGVGTVNLTDFSGSVSGQRLVRKSDLALLQEQQTQNLKGTAKVSFLSQGITATINLTLTPEPGWRTHDFPLNPGDSWQNHETVAYTGGFSYNAGSIASGSSPFDGTFPFNGPSTVSNQTISVPIGGSVATNAISASSTTSDGTVVDNIWWSPAHKNDAREHMELPLDGAQLKIDRNLSAASIPDSGTSLTAGINPSLSCAGGVTVVSGKLGNAAGTAVAVVLDKSPVSPGQKVTVGTTTGANGLYAANLTVPSENDGLSKNGSRANWGVLVTGGGASAAATLVVTPKDCTTLAYTGETSGPRGTNAVLSAQLTDLGGGSVGNKPVTFTLGSGTVTVNTNGSGLAAATLPTGNTVGNLPVSASFAGSPTMEQASDAATFAVGKVATTTSVTPSAPSVDAGDPVTFTADVASLQGGAGTPGGTVQFKVDGSDFGAPVALVGGEATSAAISTLTQATHVVQAAYSGDAGFNGSTSPTVSFLVTPTRAASTTTAEASPTTAVHGQPVTVSATVSAPGGGATPTGSVTFKRGGTVLGTGTLDGTGKATAAVSDLPVGTSQVVATYGGDSAYRSSSSAPQTVTVGQATVDATLDASDTSTVTGEAVDYTAAVAAVAPGAGVPTGTFQLFVDGNAFGAPVPLANGVATFAPVTSLRAGTHSVKAVYSGDDNFQGRTSDAVDQVVTKAGTATSVTTSPEITNEDSQFTVTATVVASAPGSGEPDGTVTFTADGDPIGTAPVVDGRASVTNDNLAPGDHAIVATYSGSDDYGTSASDPVSHTVIEGAAVIATTLQLSSSTTPATYGALISFTARVAADDGSTPRGTVQFSVDGTDVGGPVTVDGDGVAVSAALAAPEPGSHTVIASFLADAGYSGSGSIITQVVEDATATIDLSSSDVHSDYGQGVTFTAHLTSDQEGTDEPTGFVQFRVDGQKLGGAVALSDATATSPAVSDLAPGDHVVTATYSGDAHFVNGSAALTQQVAKVGTSTTLAVSSSALTYGQDVDLTATVTPVDDALGAPAGSIAFMDGTTTLATVPVAATGATGTASVVVPGLGGGAHSITAVYSGSDTFAGSTSAARTVTVAHATTYLKADAAVVRLIPLGLPLGLLKVTLRGDHGQPLAGEPVEFTVGSKSVCTATTDVDGVATCNARPLLLDLILHNGYSATFAGDANYLPSSGRGFTVK